MLDSRILNNQAQLYKITQDQTGEFQMKIQKNLKYLIIVACLLILIPSLQALSEDNAVNVIYQTSFSSDPRWITNNPSTNYWNPNLEVYNFSIEPSYRRLCLYSG